MTISVSKATFELEHFSIKETLETLYELQEVLDVKCFEIEVEIDVIYDAVTKESIFFRNPQTTMSFDQKNLYLIVDGEKTSVKGLLKKAKLYFA